MLTWNAGWCCSYATQAKIKDILFIKNLIIKLLALHSIDPAKVYLNGYSNGAMLSLSYLSTFPGEIAGCCVAAAALVIDHDDCAPVIDVPVTWVYGDLDVNVIPAGGISLVAKALIPPLDDTVSFLRGRSAAINLIKLIGATHEFSTIQNILSSQEGTDFASLMDAMI